VVSVQDHSEGVMIALLPVVSDWCKIELPHMTLVYCGKVSELKPLVFNELCKDASSLASISKPLTLRTTGVEVFGGGEDEKVDVIRLQLTPELIGMRRFVHKWNASQYMEYKPHCTVGPQGSAYGEVPSYIAFDRVAVQWGEDLISFNMKRS
jgi:2'-5' RNA ligase